jgi:hypothetical protein
MPSALRRDGGNNFSQLTKTPTQIRAADSEAAEFARLIAGHAAETMSQHRGMPFALLYSMLTPPHEAGTINWGFQRGRAPFGHGRG